MTIRFSVTPARTIPAIAMFLILVELGILFLFKNQEMSAFPGLLLGAGVIDLVGAVIIIFFAFWEVER